MYNTKESFRLSAVQHYHYQVKFDVMVLSIEERIFLVEYVFRANGEYTDDVKKMFSERFPETDLPHRNTVRNLINKFRMHGSIEDAPRSGRPTVLSEQTLNVISQSMTHSPNKSMRRLSQEVGVSLGTAHATVRKTIGLYPYRITCQHELKETDHDKRLQYCLWFKENIGEPGVLDRTFFSDEAWFHLSGYVSSQNSRVWASENPHEFVEKPLHSLKVGVWCAMSRRRIIGPIFFTQTITAERYRNEIIMPFLAELTDDEKNGYFQQDGATAHTANSSLRFLSDVFQERLISKGLWPPRSPDLSVLDFYLWGALKQKVYGNKPQNLQELRDNIQQQIASISQEERHRVFENLKRRTDLCICEQGGHFQQLL